MTQPVNGAPVYPLPSQTVTPRSGLLQLRNGVAQYFQDYSIQAVVTPVGLKYRTFALNQANPANANRIVFIPGEFEGGDLTPKPRPYGTLSRKNRNAGSVVNPRELLSWERPFTISLWSAPVPGKQTDEGESINVVEDLLEQTVRAIQYTAKATIVWGAVNIQAPPVENSFGVELLVSATQIGPIFDLVYDYVQPTANVTRG